MRRRGLRALPALAAVLTALAAIAAGCGADHELVGGRCASGFTQCGSRCVNLEDDDRNCGACGVVCAPGPCVEGQCRGELGDGAGDDANPLDGTSADGALTEGAVADGALTDGALADGLPADGANADGPVADGSADGAVGDGAAGDGTLPDGAVGDGSDDGQITCDAGLSPCGGSCVDLKGDPNNCGTCHHICPSQICTPTGCAGSTPGDIVFIGHDYQTTGAGTAQARVLSNAVFLAQQTNLNVLSYEKYANAAAVGRINNIVTSSAPAGRTLTFTSTTNDADVTGLSFNNYQVLIIADQSNAPGNVDLGALGATWAPTLAQFTQLGGIVVVLDGGGGSDAMPALVTATGLLNVTADAPLTTGTPLQVAAPADALGIGVLTPYGAGVHSVSITTEQAAANLVYVVVAPNDAGPKPPVVVHKVL
jgi:hypothetical protein